MDFSILIPRPNCPALYAGGLSGGGSGPAMVGSPTQSFTSGTTNNFSRTVTSSGNCLVLTFGYYQFSTTLVAAPTDSAGTLIAGNTPIGQVPASGGALMGLQHWILPNAAVATHNFTVNLTTGGDVLACVSEWSGLLTTGTLDAAPAGQSSPTSGTNTVGTNSSGTLAQASELIIVGMATSNAGPGANPCDITNPPSGYTTLYAQLNTALTIGFQVSAKIVNATAANSATWGWTNDSSTNGVQASLISLKAA